MLCSFLRIDKNVCFSLLIPNYTYTELAKKFCNTCEKVDFSQVLQNFLVNLVDQEHVTFHALQLSHRNDRQKKWASGSFLAETDARCIFRLVPRRFLWGLSYHSIEKNGIFEISTKNWVELHSFLSPPRTSIFGLISKADQDEVFEEKWKFAENFENYADQLSFLCWFQICHSFPIEW